MPRTFLLILEYAAMRSANYLIYFLQKIPLLGKKIPNRWYRAESKDLIYWLGAFVGQLKNILGKTAYIAIMLGLPSLLYLAIKDHEPTPERLVEYGLFFFMVLNLFLAGLPNPIFLAPRALIDYELVKLSRIDEKQYYLIQLLIHGLNTSLVMTLVLLVFNIFLPIGTLNVWLLGVLHLAYRWLFEAINLKLYQRFDYDPQVPEIKNIVYALLPLIVAYGLPLLLPDVRFAGFILHPIFIGVSVVLGLISLSYILRFPDYVRLANDKINLEQIRQRLAAVGDVQKMGGAVKDKDILLDIPAKKLEGLTDYDYLHQIFFERYSPTLRRGRRWRSLAYLAAFGAAMITGYFFRDGLADRIPTLSKALVQFSFYYFYFIGSYGERFTKILFLNMDYHLLPYSFFREPEAVTKSLKIRFKKLMALGLVPTLLLCALFTLWALIFGGRQHWPDILLVNAVFIVLTIFFNLHHLIIYHTFQPYNKNMQVKSPLTAGINFVIYIITFALWRTNNLPTPVYLIVLVIMIIYVIGGIQLMKRLAPKNFKLKT